MITAVPAISSLVGLSDLMFKLGNSVGFVSPSIPVSDVLHGAWPSRYLPIIAYVCLAYLFALPTTAFLAKRGIMLARGADRIYFPGGQEGQGYYGLPTAATALSRRLSWSSLAHS